MSSGGPGGGRRGLIGRVAFPVIFGAFLGYQAGFARYGFGRAAAVFPIALIAMGTASTLIVDAVAGERERHTLETLLASPAADIGIIAGKIAAVVLYAWVIGLIGLFAVGVASSFAPVPISPTVLVVVSLVALLEAVLAAGFGVQFSLHADSVRAAGRRFGQYAVIMNMIGAGVIGLVVAPASGAVRLGIAAVAASVLLIIDAALILLACTEGEQHTLPLAALSAALAEARVPSRMLGAATPVRSLERAVRETRPEAVVLWAHRAETASPGALRALLRYPVRRLVAGPGWGTRPAAGAERVTTLAGAIAALAGRAGGGAGDAAGDQRKV